MTNPYRELPSIDRLLEDQQISSLTKRHGHQALVSIAREVLDECRREVRSRGGLPLLTPQQMIVERASTLEPKLRRVINATGVIIHTNLGRAPLSTRAITAMSDSGVGYSNLEFELDQGERGSRYDHLSSLLCRVTGAQDGLAVNNNASALLLALSALAYGTEVVISRGQLVEIGGGFRIPDVMRQSGARVVEVGTTNRTYLRDYEAVIGDQTTALLRVHTSNFQVVGFTKSTTLDQLAILAQKHGLMLIDDLGSGALIDTQPFGLSKEPTVQESVAAGADVVLFSGDKLVGGPQAGIAVGKSEPLKAMRQHPLARAVRMSKSSIAGLGATLEHYERGDVLTEVPVWKMIAAPIDILRRRASSWVRACNGHARVVPGQSTIGGGSIPGGRLDSALCSVSPPNSNASTFQAALRSADPPVVTRIEDDCVLLDPRTVDPAEDQWVADALVWLCTKHSEQPD